MNIESKIWALTNTGTKRHAFVDGSALCRKSLKTPVWLAARGTGLAYFEAAGVSMCTRCNTAFNAAIEMDERLAEEAATPVSHPAAGTYYPAAPGATTQSEARSLVLQREQISATVYADGTYTVFAGVSIISKGRLDGTEGHLMVFFAAEALVWSAGIDDAMAAEAEAREARMAAHRAELDDSAPKSLDGVRNMVDALGGDYMAYVTGTRPRKVAHRSVLAVLGDVPVYRGTVEVKDLDGGPEWMIRIEDSTGKTIARYVFMGH